MHIPKIGFLISFTVFTLRHISVPLANLSLRLTLTWDLVFKWLRLYSVGLSW